MKTYRIEITQNVRVHFNVDVAAESEEEAMKIYESENYEGNYWEEWDDAYQYADILDETMDVWEVPV